MKIEIPNENEWIITTITCTSADLNAVDGVGRHVEGPGELEVVVELHRPVRLEVVVEPLELDEQRLRQALDAEPLDGVPFGLALLAEVINELNN